LGLSGCSGDEAPGQGSDIGIQNPDVPVDDAGPTANCVDGDKDGAYAIAADCPTGNDCDDTNSTIYPNAPEICGDGIDQSCSGSDESCGCEDKDGDGVWGISDGCPEGTDCDDLSGSRYPGNKEICDDGIDQDCSGSDQVCQCEDGDGDDYFAKSAACPQGNDCDDTNKDINPGATDICGDGIDQDCLAGDVECACIDGDGDGYGEGPTCLGPDCYDNNADAYPGATEICGDGIDQDCSGADEACPVEECTEESDTDGDGFGTANGCDEIDCDDTLKDVYPGAPEICGDGVDQDCNGSDLVCPETDCIDQDGDGYGEGADCKGPDCNDSKPNVMPEGVEVCGDGLDNDCTDGDLACPETCVDEDEDGYFAIADDCAEGTDCDDGNKDVNPGAEELCGDALDNDCTDGDLTCPEGTCTTNENCPMGMWCDTSTSECIYPKAWHYWAPVVYLDTNEGAEYPEWDYPTRADFDGDWNLGNNWDNTDNYFKSLLVYYSFVKTDTHWYIGYHFYFPRRWSTFGILGNQYENALRSVLLVVRQDDGFGTLEAMETSTENSLYRYVMQDSELGENFTDGFIKMDDSSGHPRPVIYIEDQTHNIKANKNWENDGFPGDSGLALNWDFKSSVPQDALTGEFNYALLETKGELWSRRNDLGDDKTFEPFGLFAGDKTTSDSRSPWAIKDNALEPSAPAGEVLWDPATLIRRHLPTGWGTFSSQYTYNPYAHRVDIIDLKVYEDLDGLPLQGGSDPYINLYMRDGLGNEFKVLGKAGGWIANWKAEDAQAPELYNLKLEGLLERYWFYGIEVPEEKVFGMEVRDDDGVLDDWLMDPEERYYDTLSTVQFLDFVLSDSVVQGYLPSN